MSSPEVVVMTTLGATSDDKVGIMSRVFGENGKVKTARSNIYPPPPPPPPPPRATNPDILCRNHVTDDTLSGRWPPSKIGEALNSVWSERDSPNSGWSLKFEGSLKSGMGDTRRFHSNLSDGPTNWHRLYICIRKRHPSVKIKAMCWLVLCCVSGGGHQQRHHLGPP